MKKRYTASVFVVCEDKVLLINHKKLSMWLPVGGKLNEDETPLQGAKRELMEETGILEADFPMMAGEPDGTPHGFLGFEEHYIAPDELHMNFCFMARVKSQEIHGDGSFSEHRWLTPNEAVDLDVPPNVRDLLRKIDGLL